MWDQKVWSLPKIERLHMSGWGKEFYKQQCYMFKLTHQNKQKNAWQHLVSITTLHIKLKLLFSFLFAGREMFANSLMSACVRSPRVSG